jgi:hypothetical protein
MRDNIRVFFKCDYGSQEPTDRDGLVESYMPTIFFFFFVILTKLVKEKTGARKGERIEEKDREKEEREDGTK